LFSVFHLSLGIPWLTGSGKTALVSKLTKGRENVLHIDLSHLMDRSDDDFVKGLADAVGFKPGFALLTWINSIMDIITPGKKNFLNSDPICSSDLSCHVKKESYSVSHIADMFVSFE
jgi:hypothetical protein